MTQAVPATECVAAFCVCLRTLPIPLLRYIFLHSICHLLTYDSIYWFAYCLFPPTRTLTLPGQGRLFYSLLHLQCLGWHLT